MPVQCQSGCIGPNRRISPPVPQPASSTRAGPAGNRAMYSLLDTERAQLTFHRVAYDHFAAASAIRRTGLPDFFADRLEVGR